MSKFLSRYFQRGEAGGNDGPKRNSMMLTTFDDALLATPAVTPDKINSLDNIARTQQPSPFLANSHPRSNKPASNKVEKTEKNAEQETEAVRSFLNSWWIVDFQLNGRVTYELRPQAKKESCLNGSIRWNIGLRDDWPREIYLQRIANSNGTRGMTTRLERIFTCLRAPAIHHCRSARQRRLAHFLQARCVWHGAAEPTLPRTPSAQYSSAHIVFSVSLHVSCHFTIEYVFHIPQNHQVLMHESLLL